MALRCFRCLGAPGLEHSRDCPHRTAPPPAGPVVELPWPTGDDGQPVTLERALELAAALDENERRSEEVYFVHWLTAHDPAIDAETSRLELVKHSLAAIQRYCQHYQVGAVYGDGRKFLGTVSREGTVGRALTNPFTRTFD